MQFDYDEKEMHFLVTKQRRGVCFFAAKAVNGNLLKNNDDGKKAFGSGAGLCLLCRCLFAKRLMWDSKSKTPNSKVVNTKHILHLKRSMSSKLGSHAACAPLFKKSGKVALF